MGTHLSLTPSRATLFDVISLAVCNAAYDDDEQVKESVATCREAARTEARFAYDAPLALPPPVSSHAFAPIAATTAIVDAKAVSPTPTFLAPSTHTTSSKSSSTATRSSAPPVISPALALSLLSTNDNVDWTPKLPPPPPLTTMTTTTTTTSKSPTRKRSNNNRNSRKSRTFQLHFSSYFVVVVNSVACQTYKETKIDDDGGDERRRRRRRIVIVVIGTEVATPSCSQIRFAQPNFGKVRILANFRMHESSTYVSVVGCMCAVSRQDVEETRAHRRCR
jgi:hypothetical protein